METADTGLLTIRPKWRDPRASVIISSFFAEVASR